MASPNNNGSNKGVSTPTPKVKQPVSLGFDESFLKEFDQRMASPFSQQNKNNSSASSSSSSSSSTASSSSSSSSTKTSTSAAKILFSSEGDDLGDDGIEILEEDVGVPSKKGSSSSVSSTFVPIRSVDELSSEKLFSEPLSPPLSSSTAKSRQQSTNPKPPAASVPSNSQIINLDSDEDEDAGEGKSTTTTTASTAREEEHEEGEIDEDEGDEENDDDDDEEEEEDDIVSSQTATKPSSASKASGNTTTTTKTTTANDNTNGKSTTDTVSCPMCEQVFPASEIEAHADACLGQGTTKVFFFHLIFTFTSTSPHSIDERSSVHVLYSHRFHRFEKHTVPCELMN